MNLDFTKSDTTELTHGFHPYPAKMIPQVANALIKEYGKKASILLDPYCGTGTSLIEANIRSINSIGSDLNPLARLISKVKTTTIEIQTLELHLNDFYKYLFPYRYGFQTNDNIVISNFPRIDFWFSKGVKEKLSIIKHYLISIENKDISNFFQVAFSQTIRECSWTRNNEFKLYRMTEEQIKAFKPDPFGVMESVLGNNFRGLKSFMEIKKEYNSKSIICDFNSVVAIPKRIIKQNSIDLVVTSPPYGDSSTTVAYGQFSALSNQWLGFMDNGRTLDKDLMGGKTARYFKKFNSDILNQNIEEVKNEDVGRALEVSSFYSDYQKSINHIAATIKSKGFACYVVSNRNVRGHILQTDQITKDFFEQNNFKHVDTFYRKISNKRLPKFNSSEGGKGIKRELMNTESIVIMQKN